MLRCRISSNTHFIVSQSVWYPELPEDGLSDSITLDDFLNPPINHVCKSSTIVNNNSNNSINVNLTDDVKTVKKSHHDADVHNDASDSDDDRTLVDDIETDGGRCDSVVTQTEEALHFTEDEDLITHTGEDKNILVFYNKLGCFSLHDYFPSL